jgi:phosphoenolpyruvate carboxylase
MIGSRPTKRSGGGKFTIRAIPWTLCWTQTRLFLPIWWGIGSSWKELSVLQKAELIKEYKTSPILQTYLKNLGFTLAKIEFGVWKFHIEHTQLTTKEKNTWNKTIEIELKAVHEFFNALTDNNDLLWFRPWLAQSIFYRSSMIHPLNVIQKIALERKDHVLLRETVTGISCGMLTTG